VNSEVKWIEKRVIMRIIAPEVDHIYIYDINYIYMKLCVRVCWWGCSVIVEVEGEVGGEWEKQRSRFMLN